MASIYRPKSESGKPYGNYIGSWKDATGRWRKVTLFRDKTASETRIQQMQREADLRRVGVITPNMDHAATSIMGHLEHYLDDLRHQQRVPQHIRNVRTRITEIIDTAGWKRLGDISGDSMAGVLAKLAERRVTGSLNKDLKLAVSTVNSFLKMMRAFVAWLIERNRLTQDPLKSLKMANEGRAVPRRQRRALSIEQIGKLFAVAPQKRAFIYRFLMLTGLRRSEARFLLVGDLKLDSDHPIIQLRARATKSARPDPIPVHPDLVEPLRMMTKGKSLRSRIFEAIPEVRTLRGDLDKAGIPFEDEMGRRFDIHAQRHTYSTHLILSGALPGEAQRLMRHKNPALTMNVYLHLGLDPTSKALARVHLPPIVPTSAAVERTEEYIGKTDASTRRSASSSGDASEIELVADDRSITRDIAVKYGRVVVTRQQAAQLDLLLPRDGDTVEKAGPRSSVG